MCWCCLPKIIEISPSLSKLQWAKAALRQRGGAGELEPHQKFEPPPKPTLPDIFDGVHYTPPYITPRQFSDRLYRRSLASCRVPSLTVLWRASNLSYAEVRLGWVCYIFQPQITSLAAVEPECNNRLDYVQGGRVCDSHWYLVWWCWVTTFIWTVPGRILRIDL